MVLGLALGCGERTPERDAGRATSDAAPIRVQVFTRTLDFRHDSIPDAEAALRALTPDGFVFSFTEDPAQLVEALADSDVVAFLLTSGDVLDAAQQAALERFVRDGGGFVGVHSASDTEYDWPFYEVLIGAHFASHPAIQSARVLRVSSDHPAVRFLPEAWSRLDEWYNFERDPRPDVEVLLRVDEGSYQGGAHGGDHPIAWCRQVEQGRSMYTALGHTRESWDEPLFVRHIAESLRWAAGRTGPER